MMLTVTEYVMGSKLTDVPMLMLVTMTMQLLKKTDLVTTKSLLLFQVKAVLLVDYSLVDTLRDLLVTSS